MPNPPPPNRAVAELVQGLGDEDARELVGMFLKGFDATLEILAGPDREEQRRAAHSLKSSTRIVGLMELSQLMSGLEARLAQPDGAVTPADLSTARERFTEGAPALRAFVGAAGS